MGITLERGALRIAPALPTTWPGYSATLRRGETQWTIVVERPAAKETDAEGAEQPLRVSLDGEALGPGHIPLGEDGASHQVRVTLGTPAANRR